MSFLSVYFCFIDLSFYFGIEFLELFRPPWKTPVFYDVQNFNDVLHGLFYLLELIEFSWLLVKAHDVDDAFFSAVKEL